MAGVLQRDAQAALMLGAGAGLAARLDLGAVREVAAQATHVFVVDLADVFDTERADLAARAEVASASAGAPVAREATAATTAPEVAALATPEVAAFAPALATAKVAALAPTFAAPEVAAFTATFAPAFATPGLAGWPWSAGPASGIEISPLHGYCFS
jgi:hypothetical protein